MKVFTFIAAFTTAYAQTKLWSEFCPESAPQRCDSICAAPSCKDSNACAMRKDSCCAYTCRVPTPGKKGEDIYDCSVLDGIESDKEAQYKAEFDLLDTNSDGAISVAENNQAILDKWKKNYGMFCNSNDKDKKKYGLWDQLGELLKTANDKVKKTNIGDILNGLFSKGTEKLMGDKIYPSGHRRLQHRGFSHHGPPSHHGSSHHHGPPPHYSHHWNHGRNGWGANKDVDCSQRLSLRAAWDAAHTMHKFDKNGDRTISFCEYATQRSRGASAVVVHG